MRQRWAILSSLINERDYKKIAEVGISRGINASGVLELSSNIEKYYMIDLTGDLLDMGLFETTKDKLELILVSSEIASTRFRDESLDLVFIDADHSYEAVMLDIKSWFPKVRSGGILCGHDYGAYQNCFEVKRAVDEVFPNANIEKDVLENGEVHIWWIEKK